MKWLAGLSVALWSASLAATTQADNLAYGKPYTLSTAPNYSFCRDAGDKTQLTDGQHVTGYFWTQPGTVGWQRPAGGAQQITLDLGKSEPIGGFAYTLAAGCAGVSWPKQIAVFTSEDQKSWTLVGDLWARATAKGGTPDANTYRVYRAAADDMPCRGRYVAFLVISQPYGFCDEVEVFRGDPAAKNPAQAKAYAQVGDYLAALRVKNVIAADAARLGVPAPDLANISAPSLGTLRTELPLLPIHAAVWAHNVARLAKAGFTRPIFWRNCRWDNLDPLAVPTKESVDSSPLVVEMMRGETRATAVNLLNPTKTPIDTTVVVKGLPKAAHVDCREVLYTLGAKDHVSDAIGTVASALRPGEGESVRITVPAGASRQVWISFDKPSGAAGMFDGKVVATVGDAILEQPIRLVLHDLDFPTRPRLHVGGWDYTDGDASFYKRPNAFAADKRAMLDMYTDTPWGSPNVFPRNAKFDAEGHLLNVEKLDFARLDGWVAKWPEARQFAAFYAARPGVKFFGEAPGSARFDRMVGEYFSAWQAHLAEISGGKDALLLILDEPRTAADTPVYVAWAKAVRKGAPKIRIFVDPIYPDNLKTPREVIETSDIICPYYPHIQENEWGSFWRDQTAPGTGRELYFYSCKVAARFLDPAFYHRAQAWGAFQWGAKSSFFWAFGDGGGVAGSFKLFGQTNAECSPYFAYPEGTMASKQSEGVREGVEDYECLAMLSDHERKLRAQGRDTTGLVAFLATAPYRALGNWKGQDWGETRKRDSFDRVRVEALRLLSGDGK